MTAPDDPRAWLELVGELGRGGAGTVYRGQDRRTGRDLAVKLLNVPRPTEQQRQRFLREGQVVAGLRHPGIVAVHAAGELDGRPFLAFELVPGARPLDEVARGLPLAARAALVRDAARALGHAHRQGIVHRDVKPANLLVDAQGRVRVADFGVAAGRSLERLTVSGAVVGTPEYMAPEQITAAEGRAAPAADVWALGVVLYEVLTGELPFEARGLVELAGAIVAGRFTPPRALIPEIPPALEAVCLRALAGVPGARWADGEALAHALDQALAPCPPGRTSGRKRWLVGGTLLGGAGLVTVALLAAGVEESVGEPSPRPSTRAPVPSAAAPAAPSLALLELPPAGPPPPPRVRNPVLDGLREQANAGEPELMYSCAELLRRGELGKDPVEARYWLERAAAHRFPPAMRDLALDLERRTPPDRMRAHAWLEQAGLVDGEAAWLLRERYRSGTAPGGVNPAAAQRWFQRALELDWEDANFEEAQRLLAAGRTEEAAVLLRSAAREEDNSARLLLARLILEGKITGHPGEAEVVLDALLEKKDGPSAAQRREAEDMLETILDPRDPAELQFLYGHARAGEPAAMTELGRSFRRGTIVKADLRRAMYWFRRGAEGGDLNAMSMYGQALVEGLPGQVDPDPRGAAPWLARAAELGDRPAAWCLAELHAEGRPLADPAARRRWLERAAELGSLEATHALALRLVEQGEVDRAVGSLRRCREDGHCALLLAELLLDGRAPPLDAEEVRGLIRGVLESKESGPRLLAKARELQERLSAGRRATAPAEPRR